MCSLTAKSCKISVTMKWKPTNLKRFAFKVKELTFAEYREKIVGVLEGYEKNAAIISAFNSLENTEENKTLLTNAVYLMLNRVTFGNSGSWGPRKPVKKQDKLSPSLLTAELEELFDFYKEHSIRTEKIEGAMRVMTDISGEDYTMYAKAAKMMCFSTFEEDQIMLKNTGEFIKKHKKEPSLSSKDAEERGLAIWKRYIVSDPERKAKLLGNK